MKTFCLKKWKDKPQPDGKMPQNCKSTHKGAPCQRASGKCKMKPQRDSTSITMAAIVFKRKVTKSKANKSMNQLGLSSIACGNAKQPGHLGKQCCSVSWSQTYHCKERHNLTPKYSPMWYDNFCSHKNLYSDVYNRWIHKLLNPKTTQVLQVVSG